MSNSNDHGLVARLPGVRREVVEAERRFKGSVELYRQSELDPELLDGLRGVETSTPSVNDTHYRTFKRVLDGYGAATEKEAGRTSITSASENENYTVAHGDNLLIEVDMPINGSNMIEYGFQEEVPEELSELDMAMAGYSWQFFRESRRSRAERFVDSIVSSLE